MTTFEDKVNALYGAGHLTLDALGGIDSIPPDAVASEMFPEVVGLLITGWADFDGEDRTKATALVVGAVNSAPTATALISTCAAVVPEAETLGVVAPIKDALRARAEKRPDVASAAFAATALRWLTHLAIVADTPRHALLDILGSVTNTETPEFSAAAARAATVAYDFWHDTAAYECLDRLTTSDARDDAWYGLGHAAIRNALEAEDADTIVTHLREALEPFQQAVSTGEQRADAAIYRDVIRFVTGWAAHAPAEQLADIRAAAAAHLNEYMLGGLGLPEEAGWLRPRYAVETSWLELLNQMDATITAGDDASWLEPVPLMDGLANLFRAANAFTVERTNPNGEPTAIIDLVAPAVAAPFIEDQHRLALIARWADDTEDPSGEALRDLVQQQLAGVSTPGKPRPSGRSRR
jgi:hypothetical protein